MIKKQIEAFLLQKRGYLKKSPLEVAKGIWRTSPKTSPKTKEELNKELAQIREIQSSLRLAEKIIHTDEEIKLLDTYEQILKEKDRPKRKLFFDIETTPNIVYSWRIGNDISLSHQDIIKERAIICICYKWSDEKTIHSLQWNNGCDKEIVKKFAKIIESADEVIGQNSDRFDIKWLRARCIYHNVPMIAKINSLDTLKMAKAGFYFNSNKLDYMGQFLGVGKKIDTTYDLWKNVMDGDKKALNNMISYCKEDVALLERVYDKLQQYCPVKKFKYKN